MQAMRPKPTWLIVAELELQYDVERNVEANAIPNDLDLLLVPMVSSLTQPQMDALATYITSGKPTLLSFGDIDTLLLTERLGFAGPALAAGKEAVFATVMAGLDRRDARRRGSAVIERGVRASQRLLWPSIRDLGKLRRGARLKTL